MFVKYNQALKACYDRCIVIDPISLVDIDESNEWLVEKIGEEDTTIDYEGWFGFWGWWLDMGCSGKYSRCWKCKDFHLTLSMINDISSKGSLVVTTSQTYFEEKQSNSEDIEEDDNEMEGYQSSLDKSNDNFNFNDDCNDDV